jgi:hypothetical protein
VLALALCIFASARPACAQRLLDLQVRTSALPDALAPGAAAVFWNPAAVAGLSGRGEALVVDVRGSRANGLGGTALAGAYRLDERTTFAAGYQHVGLDPIARTSTSPLADAEDPDIDIGEHVFGAALARRLSPDIVIGGIVRYARTSDVAGADGVAEFGAGVELRPRLPLAPTFAALARAEDDGTTWNGAVALATPLPAADWRVGASVGVGGSPQVHGLSHRLAALVAWQDRLTITGGLAGEPGADGRTWQPLASATLRLSRFALGVLREQLPNDFGAMHALRFSIAFD